MFDDTDDNDCINNHVHVIDIQTERKSFLSGNSARYRWRIHSFTLAANFVSKMKRERQPASTLVEKNIA
jgi:hypothetical protein